MSHLFFSVWSIFGKILADLIYNRLHASECVIYAFELVCIQILLRPGRINNSGIGFTCSSYGHKSVPGMTPFVSVENIFLTSFGFVFCTGFVKGVCVSQLAKSSLLGF